MSISPHSAGTHLTLMGPVQAASLCKFMFVGPAVLEGLHSLVSSMSSGFYVLSASSTGFPEP